METARGVEYGEAVTDIKEVTEEELVALLKPVLRKSHRTRCHGVCGK